MITEMLGLEIDCELNCHKKIQMQKIYDKLVLPIDPVPGKTQRCNDSSTTIQSQLVIT